MKAAAGATPGLTLTGTTTSTASTDRSLSQSSSSESLHHQGCARGDATSAQLVAVDDQHQQSLWQYATPAVAGLGQNQGYYAGYAQQDQQASTTTQPLPHMSVHNWHYQQPEVNCSTSTTSTGSSSSYFASYEGVAYPATVQTVTADVTPATRLNSRTQEPASASPSSPAETAATSASSPGSGSGSSSRLRLRPHSTPATLCWLERNYELCEGVCVPRNVVYFNYVDFCSRNHMQPVNAASFGKIIRQMFANLTTRRLGTRGQSRYHYYGLAVKPDSIYFSPNYSRKRGPGDA